jgi:hypothetical protein
MTEILISRERAGLAGSWQPPQRPEWVQRINDEGLGMDIRAIVPLDADSLIRQAIQNTGLSDFGADDWREPFEVYVKALEEEAALTLIGRIRMRQEVLNFLQGHLEIEDWYRRHPEIEDEQIVAPILLTGQGRSGTSFLQNVMAENPDHKTLRHWEMMFPCPPPEAATYATDPRIKKAEHQLGQWARVVPEIEGMHEFGGNVPFEDTVMMSLNFTSDAWLCAIAQVPSYAMFLAKLGHEAAFRYHKRVLKLLQWRNPRQHWVLKDVFHLGRLPAFLEAYPDACVVWSHRDPVRASASMVNLIGCMWWAGSDVPLQAGALDYCRDPAVSAARFNMVIDQIESGEIPRDRIFSVQYKNLVRDPIATVQSIHDYFGIPLTEHGRAGMETYLRENPRDNRPPHRYPIPEGEALVQARAVYARYQEYFNVPTE